MEHINQLHHPHKHSGSRKKERERAVSCSFVQFRAVAVTLAQMEACLRMGPARLQMKLPEQPQQPPDVQAKRKVRSHHLATRNRSIAPDATGQLSKLMTNVSHSLNRHYLQALSPQSPGGTLII